MKQPLTTLLIAPNSDVTLAIIYEEKTITIRNGHYDFRVGRPIIIGCYRASWAVMADITEVRHCTLGEVTKEEYLADGFETQKDLLEGLRQFFPNLDMDSPVTVIKWSNVRGWLVDHRDEYRQNILNSV